MLRSMSDGMGNFFGRKKMSKREKKLREQLFQQAVDRQIWRGKGSSKEVARQIYQDLKKLEVAALACCVHAGCGVGIGCIR